MSQSLIDLDEGVCEDEEQKGYTEWGCNEFLKCLDRDSDEALHGDMLRY